MGRGEQVEDEVVQSNLHFSFFFLEKFYYKQIKDASRTNSAGALFAVQNTLKDHGQRVDVLEPEAPFGRRKKLPAAGSAAKMTTNKRVMKNSACAAAANTHNNAKSRSIRYFAN